MNQSLVSKKQFALGVGLTNACNLSCQHCYRGTGTDSLEVNDVLRVVDALPTRAVNLGTGENGLHPHLGDLVQSLHARGVAVTMTTNGYSAKILPDDILSMFRDVEFSIDYPSQKAHNAARGEGNWELIEEQMARCKKLGIGVTLVSVLMSTNAHELAALAHLASSRFAKLRINVYQAVKNDRFSLSYQQFWDSFATLLELGELEACGEPIVRAMLGLPRVPGAGCGVETVRLTPKGEVSACVYNNAAPLKLDDLIELKENVFQHPSFQVLSTTPAVCAKCEHLETCGGGCPSRRNLKGGFNSPDFYCPIARGLPVPVLRSTANQSGTFSPKASSACTTIIAPRPPPQA